MSEHDRLRGAGEYAHWQIDNFMKAPTVHVIGASGEPAFANSWVSDATHPAIFYKDSLGVVHIEGAIGGGTLNAAAFTLPVGFRPAVAKYAPSIGETAGYIMAIGNVTVTTAGVVTVNSAATHNALVTIAISFLAA